MDRKSIFRALLMGGAVAEILVTWLSPKVISWYYNPPETPFSCAGPVNWALDRMQTTQLIGLLVGAVLGVVVLFAFRRRSAGSIHRFD